MSSVGQKLELLSNADGDAVVGAGPATPQSLNVVAIGYDLAVPAEIFNAL